LPLLEIADLHLEIAHRRRSLKILNGVNLKVRAGEMVGLIGETGSGKTLTLMSILGMFPRGARVTKGRIMFEGKDLTAMSPRELRAVRGSEIGIVFQQPRASLNPTRRVADQVADRFQDVLGFRRKQARERSWELLGQVGIPEPKVRGQHYPHQLSGGMCQRVMVGLGIAGTPRLLLADEPTTGLDVTLQMQVMDLIRDLARSAGMAVLLITHDVALVAEYCERVAVMYGGRIMEDGPTEAVLYDPKHPYTKSLVDAVSSLELGREPMAIEGTVPRFFEDVMFCPFVERCPYKTGLCAAKPPEPVATADGSLVACHLAEGTLANAADSKRQ